MSILLTSTDGSFPRLETEHFLGDVRDRAWNLLQAKPASFLVGAEVLLETQVNPGLPLQCDWRSMLKIHTDTDLLMIHSVWTLLHGTALAQVCCYQSSWSHYLDAIDTSPVFNYLASYVNRFYKGKIWTLLHHISLHHGFDFQWNRPSKPRMLRCGFGCFQLRKTNTLI